MFYSVLLEVYDNNSNRISVITEIDHTNLEQIKSEILTPYFQDEEFFVDGYLLQI